MLAGIGLIIVLYMLNLLHVLQVSRTGVNLIWQWFRQDSHGLWTECEMTRLDDNTDSSIFFYFFVINICVLFAGNVF